MRIEYDETGDILYIERAPPYASQESHEIGEGIITRSNPTSGDIESVEIQGLRKRRAGEAGIEVDLEIALRRLAGGPAGRQRAAS